MKKTILFLSFLLIATLVFSQQDPQFSQNMFNKLANNPGYAGSNQAICATALHRSQWMGFEGAPTTLNLSVDAGIPAIDLSVQWEKLVKKFNGCTEPVLGKDKSTKIISTVHALQNLDDIAGLVEILS